MQQPACTDPWTLSAKPADDVPVESDVTTSTGQPRPVVSSLQPAHRVPVKSRPTASPSLQRQLLKDRFRRQLQQRRHDWMSAARGSTGSNAVDVHTEPSPEQMEMWLREEWHRYRTECTRAGVDAELWTGDADAAVQAEQELIADMRATFVCENNVDHGAVDHDDAVQRQLDDYEEAERIATDKLLDTHFG